MIRALIWKEFREHRWTFLGFITTLFCLKPALCWMNSEEILRGGTSYSRISSDLLIVLVPLYAAILGIHTFAHERGKGTLSFLLTRPIGRLPLFTVKMTVSMTFLAFGLFASTFILNDTSSLGWDSFTSFAMKAVAPTVLAFLVMLWSTTFAASIYCRSFLTAALLGGTVTSLVLTALAALDLTQQAFIPSLIFAAASVLSIGHAVFNLPLHASLGRQVGRGIKRAMLATFVTYFALHLVSFTMRSFPGEAKIIALESTPSGLWLNTARPGPGLFYPPILGTAPIDSKGNPQVWDQHPASAFLSCSPDGNHVLLRTKDNHWGFQGSKSGLRICKKDGTTIKEIHGGVSYRKQCWSRDGKTLAYPAVVRRPWFYKGPRRSRLEIFSITEMKTKQIPIPFIEKLGTYKWEILSFHRKGQSLLILVYKNEYKKQASTIYEVNLKGITLGVHTPFADTNIINFIHTLPNGDLLFWRKGKSGANAYLTWQPKGQKLPRLLTRLSKKWVILELAEGSPWALVCRNEVVKKNKTVSKFLENVYGYQSSIAMVNLKDGLGKELTPSPQQIFVNQLYEVNNRKSSLTSRSYSCWSQKDKQFVYSTDGKTIRKIKPGETTSTLLMKISKTL